MFLVPALAALDSSAAWIAVTFFCGSVFFTSASLLQLITAAELPHRFRPRTPPPAVSPARLAPATVDWLGGRDPILRDADVQRQHVRRDEERAEYPSGQRAGLGDKAESRPLPVLRPVATGCLRGVRIPCLRLSLTPRLAGLGLLLGDPPPGL